MKLLDLFCGAGGCSAGYSKAGFTSITGVDIESQPNYQFNFVQADALDFDLSEYDVLHASPPCQAYTWGTRKGREEKFPDLIGQVRKQLRESGKLYVIENVVGAPLKHPVMLCGEMFGLKVIRHRLFEVNIPVQQPRHLKHKGTVVSGYYVTVAGHGGDSKTFKLKDWRKAMGIDWMSKPELIDAIPPAYTEWIGKEIMRYLDGVGQTSLVKHKT